MNSVRRLSILSVAATLVLVTIGGLVRATKSGLGCGTDWPHCSGKLVPALANRAVVLEFSHRLAAGVVAVLLAALAVLAWRQRYRARAAFRGAVVAFCLVVFQALLGAVVVKLELQAFSVVLHLAAAMALLGTLVYTVAASHVTHTRLGAPADLSLSRWASAAAASVLLVLMAGSYVSGRDAGLAFGDWPLMGGAVVPDLSIEANAIHFLHRALAAASAVVVATAAAKAIRRRAQMPLAARWAHVAAGAYALEVLVGAANIYTRLHPAVVTVHLALGAVIWTSLVAMVVVTRPALAGSAAGRPLGHSHPVLESSR